jgi:hypothetical protein
MTKPRTLTINTYTRRAPMRPDYINNAPHLELRTAYWPDERLGELCEQADIGVGRWTSMLEIFWPVVLPRFLVRSMSLSAHSSSRNGFWVRAS